MAGGIERAMIEVYMRETGLARGWYIRDSRPEEPRVTATIRRLAGVSVAAAMWASAMAAEPPSAEQIRDWIAALGAPQFSQREAATRSLVSAGPAALDPLREAIKTGDLEVSSRAIEIAREILAGEDAEAAAVAERFLETVAGVDDASVARLAEDTLDFHALGMADAAREKLQALGMQLTRGILATGQQGSQVKFDAGWRGTTDDLRLLVRVPAVMVVSIHGVKLDAEALAIIGRMRNVARIELYGTGVDDEKVAVLAAKLPDAQIEVRRGGKLGVAGHPNIGPCQITLVQPDSAADKAGIQVGDIVMKIDGVDVANFQELTERVGTRGPGEKLELEISRGPPAGPPERIVRMVRLDAW